ncbi:MAG: Asp-tRNA(Asn)/Glu-tRNA(Gln) amidotransferase GatCAB subunit A [Chloroflexi bacterium]|nr:Asp-tRNA(Asn)/Glu-tRNA(Gln) amidotransferase GatCAB subunit A [Chloroflexota bacterium]
MPDNLHLKSIKELNNLLVEKKISSVELVNYFFDRIDKYESKINSFISFDKEYALENAKNADAQISNGDVSLLTGIPYVVKDNIATKHFPTTAGSKILDGFQANYDATVVRKINEQGAILIGKANLDEFAMGSSTENSAFGPTKNPWNLDYVPGGSSGGPAAALSAGFCVFSLGSDTGGSIRQPASLCGITGLKPTYGAVSRYGLIAFGSSLDQIGPFTRTAEDSEIILDVIEGKDEYDSTSKGLNIEKPNIELNGLKVGLPKEYFSSYLESEVKSNVIELVDFLSSQGAIVNEVSLPHTEYALSVYYILAPAEASSNLSRYDGVKYGYSEEQVDSMWDRIEKSRSNGFGLEVKRRIMLGTYSLSSGYYDEYYGKAEKTRQIIKKELNKVFDEIDILITPTSPSTAFKLGEKTNDPMAMYSSDIMTIPANIAGIPGISIPVKDVKGLPVGAQLVGPYMSDRKILEISKNIQKLTDWHMKSAITD